jgi:hypothetical protein
MVTYSDEIAGKAKDISNASGVSEEKVRLKRHTVAVTAGHLQYRFAATFLDRQAATDRRKPHYRTLMVSDIQPIYFVFEQVYMM